MPKRKSHRLIGVSLNLPEALVKALDQLVEELETTRTEVIEELLEYGLDNVDDVFPLEEEEESENEDKTEEQEEEEQTHDPKKVNRLHRGGSFY